MTKKPKNVLVLIGDDHAAYAYGAYGNPQARTPNLDRLAESGVRFTSAYANCPMCTASRQSMLTGRMPHSIGVTQLRSVLKDEPVTLAEILKQQGYNTAAIGKMHFNSARTHGFDRLLFHREHREYLKTHPPKPVPDNINVLPPWRPFRDPARIWVNSMYWPYPAYDKDMAGTWFADESIRFLQENRDQPFLLFSSYTQPHSPFQFPIEYAGMYDPSTFKVPDIGPEDEEQIPAIFRDLTYEEKQGIQASYYTATAFLDKNIGKVLDALDELGLSENTTVVYFGDHGYCLGHHGRIEKHCFYEPAIRSPLVMRAPGFTYPGTIDHRLTEFVDIVPTVLGTLGIEPRADMEGMNLFSRDSIENERHYVFSEYYENEECMIRTKRYKYIYQSGKRMRQDGYYTPKPPNKRVRKLFDLEKDPGEFTNLAEQEDYRDMIVDFEERMLRRFRGTSPVESRMPSGLDRELQLDWYLKAWDSHV